MAEFVYLLCAATSAMCAVALLRRRKTSALSFWSGLCFVGLTLNNVELFVDLVITPSIDLGLVRSGTALVSMLVLVAGLIWESR